MDRVLAQEVPEMDIIIGAHSHDRISKERIGDVTIVQAVSDNSVLGEIVVSCHGTKITNVESRLHTLWIDAFPEYVICEHFEIACSPWKVREDR